MLLGATQLDAEDEIGQTPLFLAQRCHPTNASLHALLSGDCAAQTFDLRCDHCEEPAEPAKGLKSCGKCYAARDCGKQCQLAAWPEHKEACNARVEVRKDKTRTHFSLSAWANQIVVKPVSLSCIVMSSRL